MGGSYGVASCCMSGLVMIGGVKISPAYLILRVNRSTPVLKEKKEKKTGLIESVGPIFPTSLRSASLLHVMGVKSIPTCLILVMDRLKFSTRKIRLSEGFGSRLGPISPSLGLGVKLNGSRSKPFVKHIVRTIMMFG